MTSSPFYEEGSKVLTPGAFDFVLDSELKRAVRSQNYLTLVVPRTTSPSSSSKRGANGKG